MIKEQERVRTFWGKPEPTMFLSLIYLFSTAEQRPRRGSMGRFMVEYKLAEGASVSLGTCFGLL